MNKSPCLEDAIVYGTSLDSLDILATRRTSTAQRAPTSAYHRELSSASLRQTRETRVHARTLWRAVVCDLECEAWGWVEDGVVE